MHSISLLIINYIYYWCAILNSHLFFLFIIMLLFTYLISLILFIDQGLFNLLIISQSPGTQTETQIRYVGFRTNDSILDKIDYNEYITRRET